MRALLAALVVVTAAGVHHTTAGNAAAHRALVRPADLGKTWVAGRTPKQPGSLVCGTSVPSGVIETGSAVSPTYSRGATGPFLSESVYVYSSAAGAARFFPLAAGPGAAACVEKTLASAGASGKVAFTVTTRESLSAPRVGVRSAAYRIAGVAAVTAQKVRIYVDVVLLLRGNAISELAVSSFATPVDPATELAVARAATKRL
jgi:hypothetical protein